MATRSELRKAQWADPVIRARMEESLRKARKRDGDTQRVRALEAARTPEAIARKIAALNDPDCLARNAASTRAQWTDPSVLEKYYASHSTPEVRGRMSKGTRESWLDPDIAAARRTLNGASVTVEGVTTDYRSVRAAFEALSLPLGVHGSFRKKLKQSRHETFTWEGRKYIFDLID